MGIVWVGFYSLHPSTDYNYGRVVPEEIRKGLRDFKRFWSGVSTLHLSIYLSRVLMDQILVVSNISCIILRLEILYFCKR